MCVCYENKKKLFFATQKVIINIFLPTHPPHIAVLRDKMGKKIAPYKMDFKACVRYFLKIHYTSNLIT